MELEASKFGKLTVGDIAKYERWKKNELKKELILTMLEIYGDKLSDNAFSQIEDQLKSTPSLLDGDGDLDVSSVQYLLWLSMQQKDKDATFEQVGSWFNLEHVKEYISFLFPPALAEKKRPRTASKKVTRKKRKKKKASR